jgi:hypothetical protein
MYDSYHTVPKDPSKSDKLLTPNHVVPTNCYNQEKEVSQALTEWRPRRQLFCLLT